MALKPDVLQAFALLGIDPDTDVQTATKAYKRHALLHHPDRNHSDPQATQRFQEIGAAWNICQRHFDNPAWSYTQAQTSSTKTYNFSADDDIPLDEDELREFYMFMFAETLFGRYSRTKGQRYRYERSGQAGGGLYSFSGGLAQSQERQARNTERQRRENEEYEKRKRELELEIEQEDRERAAMAKKLKADEDRRTKALENAFRAAGAGDSASVKKAILEYDLDVNSSQKRPRHPRKQDNVLLADSLLHVVAGHCDEKLFMFIIERGANPTSLNKAQLNPFHVAIRTGNMSIVQYIMEHRGRSFDVYHPSKASPSGRTPLQLAIESGVPSVVELLVKDATTHDVERCWKIEGISEEIKDILLKKKGFVPPDADLHSPDPITSKKSQHQQELTQEKKARLAEELERAEMNHKKRAERALKRAEKDREEVATKLAQEKEQARLKAEMEEQQRLEDNRRAQEEARAKLLEETRLQVEAEKRAVASREKVKREEKENKLRLEQEKQSRMPDGPRRRSAETNKHSSSPPVVPVLSPPVASAKAVSPANELSAEERRKLRYAKMKENRKAKLAEQRQQKDEQPTRQNAEVGGGTDSASKATEKKIQPLKTVVKDTQGVEDINRQKNEAVLRRRAEQSARDKERHRRLVEERAKAAAQSNQQAESAEYVPLTPVLIRTHQEEHNETSREGKIPPRKDTPPLIVPRASFPSFAEFAMPMEDIQTCVVPDDLFREERPIARAPAEVEVVSRSVESRGGGGRPFRYSRSRR